MHPLSGRHRDCDNNKEGHHAHPARPTGPGPPPHEDKIYQLSLYQPHVLVTAINERHPSTATNFAVNIGVGDGKSCSDPVYPLYQMGYGGLAIDGAADPALFVNLPSPSIRKLTNTILRRSTWPGSSMTVNAPAIPTI